MTERKQKNEFSALFRIPIPPGTLAFGLMSAFSLALILRNADIAIRLMSDGLRLCATTVIPSLFPFMVVSELIVSGGIARALGRILARPFRFLFGVSGEGACAVILGMLCGFPVGPRCAVSLYRQNKIDRNEFSHLLTFSNNPSSAFLISTVGVSLFGSRSFGIRLYTVTLLSATLTGIAGHLIRRGMSDSTKKEAPKKRHDPSLRNRPQPKGIALFTEAVTSSALAMLKICAFVVFFSAFVGTLEYLLLDTDHSQIWSALCFGFFELTGGVLRAADCAPRVAPYLCAFLVGWSGLSVHFQMMSLCDQQDISFRPYFLAKGAQGVLNALLLYLWNLFL